MLHKLKHIIAGFEPWSFPPPPLDLAELGPPPSSLSPDKYFLPRDYTSHTDRSYYHDIPPGGLIYQPDVYRRALRWARQVSAPTIVDVGSGRAGKLEKLATRFQVIGLDVGENLYYCQQQHPWGRWIEHDLDTDESLPLSKPELRGAVVVCADVIEHLPRPELLLGKLRRALEDAAVVLISTPDRVLNPGKTAPLGPPYNSSHYREWAQIELAHLLFFHGFRYGTVAHTRSHNWTLARRTLLAELVRPRVSNRVELPR